MRVSGLTLAHEILTWNWRRTSLEVFPNVSILEWYIFVFQAHSYLLVTFLDVFNYRNSSPSRRASQWFSGKESAYQCRRHGFHPWIGKIPWRRTWQPTAVLFPGESHGQRTLAGYSPWGHRESDTTEYLTAEAGWTGCCSVAKSRPTLQPHGLKHTGLPCPSLSPRVWSNSCLLS